MCIPSGKCCSAYWLTVTPSCFIILYIVLAPCQGTPKGVLGWTRKIVPFGSRPDQNPDPLYLGGPKPDPYLTTHGFCQVWLDPLGPIPVSGCLVFPLMVAFRYPTANCKMVHLVSCYPISTHWLPLPSETQETCSLANLENERQWLGNNLWCFILGNLSGNWIWTFINVVKTTFICKRESNTLSAAFWIERQCSLNSVRPCIAWATGPGNPAAVWVWTSTTSWFGSRPIQKPNPLTVGRQNPDPYPSTCGYR
jgi:hypothetical protein